MTTETDEFPGVKVVTEAPGPVAPDSIYLHLDEVDDYNVDKVNETLYVYITGDDRVGELDVLINEFLADGIFAYGVVYPEWFDANSYSTDILDAVRQLGFIDPPVEPEDVDAIVEEIDSDE